MFLGLPSLWCSVSMSLMNESTSVRENDIQLEDEVIQEEVQTESGDVPQPYHEDYSEDDQEVNSPQIETEIGSTSHEDQEIQEEVQTESGDHEDYSEDDQEVNSPQTETEIGSTSHGTSVTRKETRALNEAKKRRLDKGKLVFEIDECAGRILGQDSQRFITKGGCLVREYGMFNGTTWKKHPDILKTNIISKCVENSTFDGKCKRSNKLRSEEAAGSGTPAEMCFKLLKRVLGHLRGRSTPKKEIFAVENLRAIVESENNKSAALEEKLKEVAVEHDEMKKCMGLMMKEIRRYQNWYLINL
nr:myb domain protein 62 [Tanacetum cinerariifolium]